jgi:uncharacterized protein
MTSGGPLLPAVDRAAFAVALTGRLRECGLATGLTATQDFARALARVAPATRTALYWTARITLVRDHPGLAVFDRVFESVFGDLVLSLDPNTRRTGPGTLAPDDEGTDRRPPADTRDGTEPDPSAALPWVTLPPAVRPGPQEAPRLTVPQRLPSRLTAEADTPFQQLDPGDAELLGRLLETALLQWPTRRTRRYTVRTGGPRIAVRETAARSRRTGWEPVRLVRAGPVHRPRRVVAVCDVSRSMQAHTVPYLHLMRALARTADAEVFAFATSLTRLTTVLAQRSAESAVDLATERVTDRFGGTRIAHCLGTLLASHHGGALRGAIVLICSDGWDGDPPRQLAAAMARLRRRAYRVIWLNPRAAAPGFEPRTATLAAALPYVDLHLAADSFAALLRVPAEIARLGRR